MEGTQLLKKEKKDGREEKQALVSHPGSDRAARKANCSRMPVTLHHRLTGG